MINKAKAHLFDNILSFWKNLKDNQYGGFYGEVTDDLEIKPHADKGTILNSRILWFFSNAYSVAQDADSLAYADVSYEFLKNAIDKKNGGVYWSLTYDGEPSDDSIHTYVMAFAVYGLCAYYIAAKKQEALDLALELFHIIEAKCKDVNHIGYIESFTGNFKPHVHSKLSDSPQVGAQGIIASKTMNTLLHIMEAYTTLYEITKNQEVKDALLNILDIVYEKIYNKQSDRLEVFFDDEYNSLVDYHSYGHDIEAAWLIDLACDALGGELDKFRSFDTRIANKIYDVGFDGHCLYNERIGDYLDKTRVWWVQAEAVVGFYNEYQKSKEEKFLKAAEDIFEFIMNHVVDKRQDSEWIWELDENNKSKGVKEMVSEWKCPYHNGRMIFELIRRN